MTDPTINQKESDMTTTDMTTTDMTTTATVPAWLDLDRVVPADLRARIAELTESGRALALEVRQWGEAAYLVDRAYNQAIKAAVAGLPVELHDMLSTLTGHEELFCLSSDMAADAGAMGECGFCGKPAWVEEAATH